MDIGTNFQTWEALISVRGIVVGSCLSLEPWSFIKMVSLSNQTLNSIGVSKIFEHEQPQYYLLFHHETKLGNGFLAFLYLLALAYCFIGLSTITARFFRSMENVVKHTRTVVEIDPCTNVKTVKHEKVWNYTVADITLLAFGTSFPQISLATIDAIRNLGNLHAGGSFCIHLKGQLHSFTPILSSQSCYIIIKTNLQFSHIIIYFKSCREPVFDHPNWFWKLKTSILS